jgi:hypothetical protein
MNAIEGFWGVAKGLGEKKMAGVRARRERAAAAERELLNRLVEPVLLRVREGIEAEVDPRNSQPPFDEAESKMLFSQVMARFHRRREVRFHALWSTASRACLASLRPAHQNQSRA